MSRHHWSMQTAFSSGVETPAAIGQKLLQTLDALGRIDPILSGWVIWESHCTPDELEAWVERGSPDPAPIKPVSLDDARENMTALVETNVYLDDWGVAQPDEGYRLTASNRHNETPLGVNLSVAAGAKGGYNRWSVNFGANWRSPPDPALLTFPVMSGLFRTMTSIWPTPWALLRGSYARYEERPGIVGRTSVETFRQTIAWMGYLSADLAKTVELPMDLIDEWTTDGGLILTAFDEPLDPDNANQMRCSDILGAIMDKASP